MIEKNTVAAKICALNERVNELVAEHSLAFERAGAQKRLDIASRVAVLVLKLDTEEMVPREKTELHFLRYAIRAQRSVYGLVTRSLLKFTPLLSESELSIARVKALLHIESYRPKAAKLHDLSLLADKESFTYETAALYGSCSVRNIRKLVEDKKLPIVGSGHGKRILRRPLTEHFPPT